MSQLPRFGQLTNLRQNGFLPCDTWVWLGSYTSSLISRRPLDQAEPGMGDRSDSSVHIHKVGILVRASDLCIMISPGHRSR